MKQILFVFAFLMIQPAVAAQWLVKEMLIPPSGVVADPDGILSDTQKKKLLDKLQLLDDMTLRVVDDDNQESKEVPIQLAVAVIEKVGTVQNSTVALLFMVHYFRANSFSHSLFYCIAWHGLLTNSF
jgi:hypothetical protein